MLKTKIAVLVSGSGTNLQALINAEKSGKIKSGQIALVISNNPGVYALQRAAENGIATAVVTKKSCGTQEAFEQEIQNHLKNAEIELVVLAGFMCILSAQFIASFKDRIINVHPSLIPSFCGKGFYGIRVHEAVLEYGVKITGATVHFVNEIPDGGKIILQKAVPVRKNDTPEILQKRVLEKAEWDILPRATELIAKALKNER